VKCIECTTKGRILVEDGDTAEGTRSPFGVVFCKIRVDRLEERSNERCLPRGTDNGSFAVHVHDCTHNY
jgi:hypothetical protein